MEEEIEVWKECGKSKLCIYYASNLGQVKSVTKKGKEKILKGSPDKDGYLSIEISRKRLRIHRLVIFAFREKKNDEVDHINRIRTDNRLVNLQYVSRYENSLNNYKYRTDILEKDPKRRQRIIHNELLATKINCPCGSITSKANKPRHEKSKKHQNYLNNPTN